MRLTFPFALIILLVSSCTPIPKNKQKLVVGRNISDYFSKAQTKLYTISADGSELAFMKFNGEDYDLYVRDIESGAERSLGVPIEGSVTRLVWKEQHLLYLEDLHGDWSTNLHSVNTQTGAHINLTPFDKIHVKMVSLLPDSQGVVLIAHNQREERSSDVYRLNVITGQMRMVAQSPGNVIFWLPDRTGVIRAAIVSDASGSRLMYRKTNQDPFKAIQETSFNGILWPVAFCEDNQCFYALSNLSTNNRSLVVYNPEERRIVKELYVPENVDLYEAYFSEKHGEVAMLSYLDDHMGFELMHDSFKSLSERIQQDLAGKNVYIKNMDQEEKKAVLYADSEDSPGSYFLFDESKSKLEKLAVLNEVLEDEELNPARHIKFISTDSLEVNGYLFLPKKADTSNIPFVVFCNDFIQRRYYRNFDPLAQYLVDQGYGVLLMNYRGKYGFGKEFMEKAHGQWKHRIVDDLKSGVDWLISRGYTTEGKVALYGGGFGSLVVMNSMIRHPEMFSCAVSKNGLYDLNCFFNSIPPDRQAYLELLYGVFGHPEKDSALIIEESPYNHLDEIKAPILFMHDSAGWMCDMDIVTSMVRELEEQEVDVEHFIVDNSRKFLSEEKNQVTYYLEVLEFLDKHLKREQSIQ